MRALTLVQPWAWAVAQAGKNVENRGWAPPHWLIDRRFAIHAGLKRERAALRHLGVEVPLFLDQAAVVAVATLRGVAQWSDAEEPRRRLHGSNLPHVKPGMCLSPELAGFFVGLSPWYVPGEVGWLLRDVVALPVPVPCRGAQGLWVLPADVEVEVLRQVALVEKGK